MNKTEYNNFLYQLLIEDNPEPQYINCPPVDPRGKIDDQMAFNIAKELFEIGVSLKKWSSDATLYIANVVIGAAEVQNPAISLQLYLSGLAGLYHKNANLSAPGNCAVMDVINPPAPNLQPMGDLVRGSFPIIEQPFCIPFVIFDDHELQTSSKDRYAKFNQPMSKDEMAITQPLGQRYFGESATSLIIPVNTGEVNF